MVNFITAFLAFIKTYLATLILGKGMGLMVG
jgi:hypothetical protein